MGKEQHYACFEHCAYIQTMHHLKYFRMLSSSILCVMTSTDNIIDAVVMCLSDNKSTPLNKSLDPPLLKQLSIL